VTDDLMKHATPTQLSVLDQAQGAPPASPQRPVFPEPATLKNLAKLRKAQARAIEKLASDSLTARERRRLRAALDKVAGDDFDAVLARIDAWLADEEATRRPRLAQQIRDVCAAAGVDLVVLTKNPLELRLAPLGVKVDIDRDRSLITFGGQRLAECGANAQQILSARQDALKLLEVGTWDAANFHRVLRKAWTQAGGDGWQELTDVLPLVALGLQDLRFKRDPSASTFHSYGRARLAWDLWRLRRDRMLTVDGWRLTLGPATGSSTKDKKRVFWLEDDRGQGQYYLTLRFVRDGADD